MVEEQKRREHKRMKLETSGVRLGMSSFYGACDWLTGLRPAEIGRREKHLALGTFKSGVDLPVYLLSVYICSACAMSIWYFLCLVFAI